jgi:exonuclease SbcD
LKRYLGAENKEEQLNQLLQDSWAALADKYCDTKGVNILTTHLYMLKRGGEILEEPDGEKPLRIGMPISYRLHSASNSIYGFGALASFSECRRASSPVVYQAVHCPIVFGSGTGKESSPN